MSQPPISSPSQASDAQGNAALENVEGAFTEIQTDMYKFVGNGQTTPADIAGRILDLDAIKDPSLKEMAENPDVAAFVSTKMLDHPANKHLKGQHFDEAVAKGEHFFAEGGPSLKQICTMLKPHIKDLKSMLQAHRDSTASGIDMSTGQQKAIGGPKMAPGSGLPIGF